MNDHWTLYVCGSRGSMPVHGKKFEEFGGATSCYILKKGRHAIVLDCGTGFIMAGDILEDCDTVDIWLTHIHYDHLMGILGYSVIPKDAKVKFYGTFNQWMGRDTINEFFKKPFWPIVPEIGPCVHVDSPGMRELEDGVKVILIPSNHPNEASILRIETEEGILCMMADYEHGDEPAEEYLKDCTTLIFDGMFTEEEFESHKGWGHSCWSEGCRLAEKYHIPHLIITHHDPRKTDEELRLIEIEARKRFPAIHFARMGDMRTL